VRLNGVKELLQQLHLQLPHSLNRLDNLLLLLLLRRFLHHLLLEFQFQPKAVNHRSLL
jgi:hypothetical protein